MDLLGHGSDGVVSFRFTGYVLIASELYERRRERSAAGGGGSGSVGEQAWILLLPHGSFLLNLNALVV